MQIRTVLAAAILVGGCDGGEGFPDAPIPDAMPPGGTFSMMWTLTDTSTSMPVSCDDANATFITITVREQGAGSGLVEQFSCTSPQGTSRPLPPGTYVLGFELRGPGFLITTAPGRSDVVVVSNQDTPIGTVDFAFDASGAVSFRLSAGATTTNCGPIVGMGAAIDTIALTLTKGGTCVPVTWMVGAAAYTATCPTPAPTTCFESTVDVVAMGLDSGRYQLAAVGNIGAAACWTGMREVRAPTGGATAMSTLSMTYQAAVVGCPPMP